MKMNMIISKKHIVLSALVLRSEERRVGKECYS